MKGSYFWFWEFPTTGWHACKVKKHFHFLIICIYFTLCAQRLPNDSFFQPLLCMTLICSDWSISFKSVLWSFNAPKAAPSGKECICIFIQTMKRPQVGGQYAMFHVDVNMNGLGFVLNTTRSMIQMRLFLWETITLYNGALSDLKLCRMFSFMKVIFRNP